MSTDADQRALNAVYEIRAYLDSGMPHAQKIALAQTIVLREQRWARQRAINDALAMLAVMATPQELVDYLILEASDLSP